MCHPRTPDNNVPDWSCIVRHGEEKLLPRPNPGGGTCSRAVGIGSEHMQTLNSGADTDSLPSECVLKPFYTIRETQLRRRLLLGEIAADVRLIRSDVHYFLDRCLVSGPAMMPAVELIPTRAPLCAPTRGLLGRADRSQQNESKTGTTDLICARSVYIL